jgi:sec-independent protein translocase protein TatB
MVAPQPIELASLGMADSLILMVMALVVFGPRRLPQIGRQIGKLMYEFRKASNDFKFQMEEELRLAEEADRRKKEEAERQRVAALPAPAPTEVPAPAQTVEAQADIGAVESPTASPYPGETTYPEQYPPESAASNSESVSTTPRIQPPLIGEQVSAAPPSAVAPQEAGSADAVSSEDNAAVVPERISAPVEDASAQAIPVAAPQIESPSPKEPVSQHG